MKVLVIIGPIVMHYCFEMPGVMTDINDVTSVIPEITAEKFVELKNSGVLWDINNTLRYSGDPPEQTVEIFKNKISYF